MLSDFVATPAVTENSAQSPAQNANVINENENRHDEFESSAENADKKAGGTNSNYQGITSPSSEQKNQTNKANQTSTGKDSVKSFPLSAIVDAGSSTAGSSSEAANISLNYTPDQIEEENQENSTFVETEKSVFSPSVADIDLSALPHGTEVHLNDEFEFPGYAFVETEECSVGLNENYGLNNWRESDRNIPTIVNSSYYEEQTESNLNENEGFDEDSYEDFYGEAQVEFDASFYENPANYANVSTFMYPDYFGYHYEPFETSTSQPIKSNHPLTKCFSIPEEPASPGYEMSHARLNASEVSENNGSAETSDMSQVSPNPSTNSADRKFYTLQNSTSTDSLNVYKSYLESVAKGLKRIDDENDDCPETCILDDDEEEDLYENLPLPQASELSKKDEIKTDVAPETSLTGTNDPKTSFVPDDIGSLEAESWIQDLPDLPTISGYRDEDRSILEPDVELNYDQNRFQESGHFESYNAYQNDYEEDPFKIVYDDYEPEIEALCEQTEEESEINPSVDMEVEKVRNAEACLTAAYGVLAQLQGLESELETDIVEDDFNANFPEASLDKQPELEIRSSHPKTFQGEGFEAGLENVAESGFGGERGDGRGDGLEEKVGSNKNINSGCITATRTNYTHPDENNSDANLSAYGDCKIEQSSKDANKSFLNRSNENFDSIHPSNTSANVVDRVTTLPIDTPDYEPSLFTQEQKNPQNSGKNSVYGSDFNSSPGSPQIAKRERVGISSITAMDSLPSSSSDSSVVKAEYKLRRDKFLGRVGSGSTNSNNSPSVTNSAEKEVQINLAQESTENPAPRLDSSHRSEFDNPFPLSQTDVSYFNPPIDLNQETALKNFPENRISVHLDESAPENLQNARPEDFLKNSEMDENAARKQVEHALRSAMSSENTKFDYKQFSLDLDLADIQNVLKEIELMSQEQEQEKTHDSYFELASQANENKQSNFAFLSQDQKNMSANSQWAKHEQKQFRANFERVSKTFEESPSESTSRFLFGRGGPTYERAESEPQQWLTAPTRLESEESVQSEESRLSVVDIDNFNLSSKVGDKFLTQSSISNSYLDIQETKISSSTSAIHIAEEFDNYYGNMSPGYATSDVTITETHFCDDDYAIDNSLYEFEHNEPYQYFASFGAVEFSEPKNSFHSFEVDDYQTEPNRNDLEDDVYPWVFGNTESVEVPKNDNFQSAYDPQSSKNFTNYQTIDEDISPRINSTSDNQLEMNQLGFERTESPIYENIPFKMQNLNPESIINNENYLESPNFEAEYFPNSFDQNEKTPDDVHAPFSDVIYEDNFSNYQNDGLEATDAGNNSGQILISEVPPESELQSEFDSYQGGIPMPDEFEESFSSVYYGSSFENNPNNIHPSIGQDNASVSVGGNFDFKSQTAAQRCVIGLQSTGDKGKEILTATEKGNYGDVIVSYASTEVAPPTTFQNETKKYFQQQSSSPNCNLLKGLKNIDTKTDATAFELSKSSSGSQIYNNYNSPLNSSYQHTNIETASDFYLSETNRVEISEDMMSANYFQNDTCDSGISNIYDSFTDPKSELESNNNINPELFSSEVEQKKLAEKFAIEQSNLFDLWMREKKANAKNKQNVNSSESSSAKREVGLQTGLSIDQQSSKNEENVAENVKIHDLKRRNLRSFGTEMSIQIDTNEAQNLKLSSQISNQTNNSTQNERKSLTNRNTSPLKKPNVCQCCANNLDKTTSKMNPGKTISEIRDLPTFSEFNLGSNFINSVSLYEKEELIKMLQSSSMYTSPKCCTSISGNPSNFSLSEISQKEPGNSNDFKNSSNKSSLDTSECNNCNRVKLDTQSSLSISGPEMYKHLYTCKDPDCSTKVPKIAETSHLNRHHQFDCQHTNNRSIELITGSDNMHKQLYDSNGNSSLTKCNLREIYSNKESKSAVSEKLAGIKESKNDGKNVQKGIQMMNLPLEALGGTMAAEMGFEEYKTEEKSAGLCCKSCGQMANDTQRLLSEKLALERLLFSPENRGEALSCELPGEDLASSADKLRIGVTKSINSNSNIYHFCNSTSGATKNNATRNINIATTGSIVTSSNNGTSVTRTSLLTPTEFSPCLQPIHNSIQYSSSTASSEILTSSFHNFFTSYLLSNTISPLLSKTELTESTSKTVNTTDSNLSSLPTFKFTYEDNLASNLSTRKSQETSENLRFRSLSYLRDELINSSENLNQEVDAITNKNGISSSNVSGIFDPSSIETPTPVDVTETPLLANLGKGYLESNLSKFELSQIHQEAIEARRKEEELQKLESRRLNDILELCSSISSRPSSSTSILDVKYSTKPDVDKFDRRNITSRDNRTSPVGSTGESSANSSAGSHTVKNLQQHPSSVNSLQQHPSSVNSVQQHPSSVNSVQQHPSSVRTSQQYHLNVNKHYQIPQQKNKNLLQEITEGGDYFDLEDLDSIRLNDMYKQRSRNHSSLERRNYASSSSSNFQKHSSVRPNHPHPRPHSSTGTRHPTPSSPSLQPHNNFTTRRGAMQTQEGHHSSPQQERFTSGGGNLGQMQRKLELLQSGFDSCTKQSVAELQWLNTKYERELADAQKERECLKQVTHKKDMSETSVTKLYNQELQNVSSMAHTIELLKAQHQITGQQIEVCPEAHREQWLIQYASEANQLAQCLKNFEALQLRVNKLAEEASRSISVSVSSSTASSHPLNSSYQPGQEFHATASYQQLANDEQVLAEKVRAKAVFIDSLETKMKKLDLQIESDRRQFEAEKQNLLNHIQMLETGHNTNEFDQSLLSNIQSSPFELGSRLSQIHTQGRSNSALGHSLPLNPRLLSPSPPDNIHTRRKTRDTSSRHNRNISQPGFYDSMRNTPTNFIESSSDRPFFYTNTRLIDPKIPFFGSKANVSHENTKSIHESFANTSRSFPVEVINVSSSRTTEMPDYQLIRDNPNLNTALGVFNTSSNPGVLSAADYARPNYQSHSATASPVPSRTNRPIRPIASSLGMKIPNPPMHTPARSSFANLGPTNHGMSVSPLPQNIGSQKMHPASLEPVNPISITSQRPLAKTHISSVQQQVTGLQIPGFPQSSQLGNLVSGVPNIAGIPGVVGVQNITGYQNFPGALNSSGLQNASGLHQNISSLPNQTIGFVAPHQQASAKFPLTNQRGVIQPVLTNHSSVSKSSQLYEQVFPVSRTSVPVNRLSGLLIPASNFQTNSDLRQASSAAFYQDSQKRF